VARPPRGARLSGVVEPNRPRRIDAAHYDLAYAWYHDDVEFYVRTAREARGPVLEVACGTGRITLPALEAGADVDGLDLDPGMLAQLRRKAEARGLRPRVIEADMRDFTMPRRYRLVIIPFRAFMHALGTEDQLRTLRCCREHLEPEGRLVLDLFFPNMERLVNATGERMMEREFQNPDTGLPVRIWSRRVVDRVNQLLQAEVEVEELDLAGGVSASHPHGFTLRWVWKSEMELLLRVAGFTRWEVYGGFDRRALESDTDHMIWSAWRD
jgi:SAM-dependent methyltransferase